jgi:chromosome partitioning protein
MVTSKVSKPTSKSNATKSVAPPIKQAATKPSAPLRKPIEHFHQAKIVTSYNMKGGSGKTQLCMQLAGTLGARGYRVAVVDMDDQSTSCSWSSYAPSEKPFPAVVMSMHAHHEKMVGEVKKILNVYDFIFIDTPPALKSTIPWVALNLSDLGLMPVIPLPEGIWAAGPSKELGLRAQIQNPGLKLCMVPMAVGRGNIYDVYLESLQDLSEEGFPVMDAKTSNINAYPECSSLGAIASNSPARSARATAEINTITDAVLTILGVGL